VNLYRVADAVIASNIPLREATVVTSSESECVLVVKPTGATPPAAATAYQHWTDGKGKPYVWFSRSQSNYHIRVGSYAEFVVSNKADTIDCYPAPDVPVETIRHLFLDMVLPLALSRRGRLSIHASAVATPSGAVVFAGSSGLGKSTLAASFAQDNCPLLSDDFVVIKQDGDRALAIPSYPGLRLWADSVSTIFKDAPLSSPVAHYTTKHRINPAAAAEIPAEISIYRICVLSGEGDDWDGGDVGLQPLSKREAIIELSKYSHLLDTSDARDLESRFNQLNALVSNVPCYRLFFPYDFSRLPAVRAAVIGPVAVRAAET
jgi:hypothetical protein